MRRGLMAWDPAELPVSTVEARLAKVRSAMAAQKLDAFAAYTNIARPAAVSWLSGFTPYWSEGVYCVPREGDPMFATALSKRVAEWIGGVMAKGEVIPTPAPGAAIGKRLAAAGAKRIGIPDLDDLPARQAQAILENAPGLELVDASDLFNAIRGDVDDAERNFVRKASAIAQDALQHANTSALYVQDLIASCETAARKAAAEEIFLSVAPDLSAGAQFHRTDTATALGDAFALRISLAYKAGWTRLTRSFARDVQVNKQFAAAQAAFDALGSLDPSTAAQTLGSALKAAGGELKSWSLEQPRGSYPLVTVASSAMPSSDFRAGAPYVLNIEGTIGGAHWCASRSIT